MAVFATAFEGQLALVAARSFAQHQAVAAQAVVRGVEKEDAPGLGLVELAFGFDAGNGSEGKFDFVPDGAGTVAVVAAAVVDQKLVFARRYLQHLFPPFTFSRGIRKVTSPRAPGRAV
jgi:hypothetical protein